MARCLHDRAQWRTSMEGVTYCPLCRRNDRPELAAMVAGLTFLANVQHQRLLEMSEQHERKARVQ